MRFHNISQVILYYNDYMYYHWYIMYTNLNDDFPAFYIDIKTMIKNSLF